MDGVGDGVKGSECVIHFRVHYPAKLVSMMTTELELELAEASDGLTNDFVICLLL